MRTQIKAKGQNHITDITGFVDLTKVIAFDTIDAQDADKKIYYQIILNYESLQGWLFYEMTKNDRTLLVKKLLDLHK
jgi:hypothetical protein